MDNLDLLELLNQDALIDPDDLEFTIASLRQQKQINQSLDLMEQRHRAEEAIDRRNNPASASFFDALAAARLEGLRAGYGL